MKSASMIEFNLINLDVLELFRLQWYKRLQAFSADEKHQTSKGNIYVGQKYRKSNKNELGALVKKGIR